MGAPGWYDDPDRVPGQQRWWTGQEWGDLTRGGPVLTAPRAPHPPSGYAATQYGSPPPEDVIGGPVGSPRRTLAWVAGSAVLAILIVVGVLLGSGGGATRAPIGAPGTAAPSFPAPPTTDTGIPPGTVRILDPDAGISYAYLGEGWREVDFEQRAEMRTVHGQFIVTQEAVPGGGTFIAEATSGLLAEQFGTVAPSGYADLIGPVADSFRANYYPAPNEQNILTSEALTVAGRPAHLLEFDLRWDIAGYDSTGERAALLVLDTGKEVPALVFVSVPNTHAELYGIIDQLIASIQLL